MKSLIQLYKEADADEALRSEYIEAAENGKIEEFLKAHGCEATLSEFDEFMMNSSEKSGELDDDELDNVAAGRKCGTVYKDNRPVVAIINKCHRFKCKHCKSDDSSLTYEMLDAFEGGRCSVCWASAACGNCIYCKYKGGLWICYNDERINN